MKINCKLLLKNISLDFLTNSNRFGKALETKDRNEQRTVYTYDSKGRLSRLIGPYELAANKPYTIAYEYYPEAAIGYAKTRNYDPYHQKDIETYTYSDGLGRTLQVQKTASIFTQADAEDKEGYLVSGKVIYDGLGRTVETYHPTSTTTAGFSTAVSSLPPEVVEYDQVSRPIKVTQSDGSSITHDFKIGDYGSIGVLIATQTDALGNQRTVYNDSKGRTVASKQNELLTQYGYNALGESIWVEDAMNNRSSSIYNWLGQRVSYQHPDAGTTTYSYDLAGNLTNRVTANIRDTFGDKGAIHYEYDYTRLSGIRYPVNPQNNVSYYYGEAEKSASRRGRLWYVQDGSGGQEFFYGKLGEVEKEIRTLRITPTDIQTYITQYQYDTWNRLEKLVYPDGEEVLYGYNRAGNLNRITGSKEGHSYPYLKQVGYNVQEQKVYVKYGNDVQTHYSYEPVMQRLAQMSVTSGARNLLDNRYGYDLMGNITSVRNDAPAVNNSLGGSSLQEYTYDSYYRLSTATGGYQGEFEQADYQLTMGYNDLHSITRKELLHTVNQQQKGYTLDYSYGDALHPHALSSVQEVGKPRARDYQYDGNGNPLNYTEHESFRKFSWDEENRLMGINDNGELHQYTYDHNGERVLKSRSDAQQVAINGQSAASIVHSDGYIGYVNPYFVISKGKFTKHYYEGATRIVSKLGTGAFSQPLKITAGGINYTVLTGEQQRALDAYIRSLGIPPGPPTQQGIYGTPDYTGIPYPITPDQEVEQDYTPPQGWPRNPKFNEKGDVPGPPAQFGPPVSPEEVKAGEGFIGTGLAEQNIYYMHSDHLGSTSYITAQNGSITQHVEYMAFGEVLFEEHSSSFSSPYLYNGKELDRETGYYYYGARYYDPKVSIFLNVDPLAEQAPNWSPYRYGFNNPINFTDPTGMFESKSDAKSWAKENDISTGWFSRNKVNKSEDGTWSVDNKKDGVSYSRADSGTGLSTERADGVVESVFIGANKSYSQQASDVWNSPISRVIVPDKIGLSLSSSITAYAGMSKGLNFDWITRGHDASATPYVTFTVGGQVGSQILADAVGGVSIGYYATSDMRSLRVGEASEGLLGWSVYGGGGAGLGVGGSFTGSVGFQSDPLLSRPTWVSATGSAGASIGIGVSAGISKTYPVFNSQFKRK